MSIATTPPNRATAIIASLAALLLFVACSSVSGGIKSPVNLPGGPSALANGQKIGRVAVSLDQQKLPPEVIQVAELYEVTRILDSRVREKLSVSVMASGGNLDVEVDVIGMRLRSNGTAIWWGVMAGTDWITVDVTVTDGGRAIKQFQTRTSTALGGFILGGRTARLERMINTLATRIADGI